MGLAAVIAWLCDPEDNYCGRGPRKRDRAEIVKQFGTDSLKIQLHLLPCCDVGTDNPILFEGALLQAFEKLHGELPKFNCRHETPADKSRDVAEQVVLAFAATPSDPNSGDAVRDV